MAKRRARENEEEKEEEESKNEAAGEYEQQRAQRIKENMDRMKKLGLLELSKKLKPEIPRSNKPPSQKNKNPSSDDPPRRSSRLKSMDPVSYSERRERSKGEKLPKNVEISIEEGKNPEFYTKEHKKLLGSYKTSWTLNEDGYDAEGERIYDPYFGKSCHQCRQKTLGRRTECSKCKSIQGQFCGDCLYMRYGENVKEVNENPSWICPVCRDICNCSRCRRVKGWNPTAQIYKKVKKLGYKSVAHYLIMTKQKEKEEPGNGNPPSIKTSEPSDDLADETAVSDESDDDKNEILEKQKDDEESDHDSEDEDADDSE